LTSLSDRIRGIVGSSSPQLPAASPRACDLSSLRGEWRDECFVVEKRFAPSARHGRETVGAIADRLAQSAEQASWFAGGAPACAPFVFVDLETTGLSGGAGTQAFLVGCASFDADGAFLVRQFLLTTYADERPLLESVRGTIGRAGALVSFNGKSFDAPLLETRYLFHRLEWIGARVPHVDVLHPARRFWRADDCSLAALERSIVGAQRSGDVPGFEVPSRYFQFLRTGDARPLQAVLDHNRLDLLTLAALAARLLHLARVGPDGVRTSREALALGHVFARAGMDVQAREAFDRALALCAAPAGAYDATRVEALRALAVAWRRARHYERAARCWSQLLEIRGCPAIVVREATEALAIHHEHRVRDLAAARTFALRGLEMDATPAPPAASWTRAVQHRLQRLERKMTVSATPRSLLS
jgi:uncharacterized protein